MTMKVTEFLPQHVLLIIKLPNLQIIDLKQNLIDGLEKIKKHVSLGLIQEH